MSSDASVGTHLAPKIASSLSAACDIPTPPSADSGEISFATVQSYIVANAPNINPPPPPHVVADPQSTETQEDAAASISVSPDDQNNNNNNNNFTVHHQQSAIRDLQIKLAMITYRDGEGRTPIHWAFALKNFELAKRLMSLIQEIQQHHHQHPHEVKLVDQEDAAAAGTSEKSSSSSLKEKVQQQQQQQFVIPTWSLPPDTNFTTILNTACAVSAPTELITELIFLATGILPPSRDGGTHLSHNHHQQQQYEGTSTTTTSSAHPFIDLQDFQGNNGILNAASRGNIKLVTLLATHYFADPRIKNKRGQSVLHRIVHRGDTTAVEEIILLMRRRFPLEVKKFVNSPDSNGDTALHYASHEENKEVGELLLRNGADRNIKNKDGKEFWQL